MRKILALFLLQVLVCANCLAKNKPAITFTYKDSVYNLGEITMGHVKRYLFEFKNTGRGTLRITDIKSDNRSLTFKWPKKPVKPRKKGTITITYTADENAAVGAFKSNLLITSNASPQPSSFLHIKGSILFSEDGAIPPSASRPAYIDIPRR